MLPDRYGLIYAWIFFAVVTSRSFLGGNELCSEWRLLEGGDELNELVAGQNLSPRMWNLGSQSARTPETVAVSP
jgi:hypothetical protein